MTCSIWDGILGQKKTLGKNSERKKKKNTGWSLVHSNIPVLTLTVTNVPGWCQILTTGKTKWGATGTLHTIQLSSESGGGGGGFGGLVAQLCLFVTPWIATCLAPLSLQFSRQQYWSGLPFPSPGDLPSPGTEPRTRALQMDSLPTELPNSLPF